MKTPSCRETAYEAGWQHVEPAGAGDRSVEQRLHFRRQQYVVQRISAVTGIFSNVAGSATNSIQGGYSGDKGPAIDAKMANLGAWVDASSRLYIADGGNNRVRYVRWRPQLLTLRPHWLLVNGRWVQRAVRRR